MTDKELLELAAKAAGIVYDPLHQLIKVTTGWHAWNPLTDDGDALRLAVKLGMDLEVRLKRMEPHTVVRLNAGGGVEEGHVDDAVRATRRAIVRAAAEIGKDMP